MDNDNVLCSIKPWCHGADHGINLSQHLFTIKRTLQQSLMRALDVKPVHAVNMVSVEGPIRVNNVDHHVRATSEMIVPIQTVIEPVEDEEEEEEEVTKPSRSFREEPLKICGQHHHCRDICEDDQDDEDVELEDEEEACDEDEICEDDEEGEEECDEDDEEEDEVEEEFCISIIDCIPVNVQCRDLSEVKSTSKCPQRMPSPCREIKQSPPNDDPENKDKDDKSEDINSKDEINNECTRDDDGDDACDDLHQECTNISKEALLEICKKYKLYDEQSRVNRTKSETEDIEDKPEGKATAKQENSKNKSTKKMEEDDDSKEDQKDEKTNKPVKYLYEDEEAEEDENKYYGLERPCKAAPFGCDEKAKKIDVCPPVTLERDYSHYDEGVPDDENVDIFYKTSPKFSQVTRGSDKSANKISTQVDSKSNNRIYVNVSNRSESFSCSSTTSLGINEDGSYYDEDFHKESASKARSSTTENKLNCDKINRSREETSYFEYIRTDDKEDRKAIKTPKKYFEGKYNTGNFNNNNPIELTEEQGDYYERDSEGKNSGDTGERGYVDVKDRGDYTGYCFGKHEDDVCDNVEKCDTMMVRESNKCHFKERDNQRSTQKEVYHNDNEPSCTTASAAGECYPCTVKSQLKYQAYGHSSVHKSNDNYFTPSVLNPCEPPSRDNSHKSLTQGSETAANLFNSTEPILFNSAEPILFNNIEPILTNNVEPNFLSVDTDEIVQPNETPDSVAASPESEVGFALTSINFEHYKRVFESMKQRAFGDDFEDYFEACSPDIYEEDNSTPSMTTVEKPLVVSGVSASDNNLDKKNSSKQGGFLKSLLGIITKSSKKKIHKVARTSFTENQLNSAETASDKIQLSEKKYFNFGRYKLKNREKLMTIDDLITIKKLKSKCDRKPKLKLGKTFVQPARNELSDSAVCNAGVSTSNNPVASMANSNVKKGDVVKENSSNKDDKEINNVGHNYNDGKVAVDDTLVNTGEKNSNIKAGNVNTTLGSGSHGIRKSTEAGAVWASKENVAKREADDLSTAEKYSQKTEGRPRGVVFRATLEETTSAEYESRTVKLVNSTHIRRHSKLTEEGDKGRTVCSLYEFVENDDRSGGDTSPSKNVYQHSLPVDLEVSGHGSNKSRVLPEAETLSTLKSLTPTSEIISMAKAPKNAQAGGSKYDTSTVQEAVITENPQKSASKENENLLQNVDKIKPIIESKSRTVGQEDGAFIKSSRSKQARLKPEDNFANTVKRSVYNSAKKIESNTNLIKNMIAESVISLKTSNITRDSMPTPSFTELCITQPSLTSNSLISSSLARSDRKNHNIVSTSGKSLKSEGNSNGASTENVCRHETDLNIAKIARRNKSAKSETKVQLKYPFVKNIAMAEDRSRSDKKRYPFCKSGSCDRTNSGKTIKKLKKNSNTLLLNKNITFRETSNAPFKCKSFTQLRDLEGCKQKRNVCSKEQAHAMNSSAFDNNNQNANCDDEDDPTIYVPHNVSNVVFPDNQKPLQNIRDMVGLAGISEGQTMSTQEGTSSKLVMETFMLDGSMDSEMTSNLVSYEHPSFRNNAVCRLDDVHDRLNPQQDLLIQNAHDEIARNDSCLVKTAEIDTKAAILDNSKMHDMQLKTVTSNESSSAQEKCIQNKIEDTNIAAVKSGLNRIEAPVQKQHTEVTGKLLDGRKGLRESRHLGFDERRETSPVTELVGQKNTRCLWKYGNYEDAQSSSADKNDTVNLGRYAKYNIVDTNKDQLGDGQKQKYANYGSLLVGNDRKNDRQGQEVQLFFGGSYTAPAQYTQAAHDEEIARSGYVSGEKRFNNKFSSAALYTTAINDAVGPKDTGKSDYLESKSPLIHMNFGANWSAMEGNTETDIGKSTNYTEGNALHSHPKISGRTFKSNDDYFEHVSGASKDTESKIKSTYSAAWKISEANKCKLEEVNDIQFWSPKFSSPLSKDVRICKMADAILDRKSEKAHDADCWSNRVYSPGTGSGVAWKRDDTLVEIKSTEINHIVGWRTPTNSPERRVEKSLPLTENVSLVKDEKRGWGGSPNTAASGEGNPWAMGGSVPQKKATEIVTEESLMPNSGNGGTTSKSVGQGDHHFETTVGHDGWGNTSKYLLTRSPPLVLASRANDAKVHGKGSARDVTRDSAEVKDKQKENINIWNTIGKSELNREESGNQRTDAKHFSHREMLSATRRDKMESEPVRKVKETTSPKHGSKWESNKYGNQINSAQIAEDLNMNKEGVTHREKAEAPPTVCKSSSPTNRNSTIGRQAQEIALNTSRIVQDQPLNQTFKVNQNSAKKEKSAHYARKDDKDVNTIKDQADAISRETKGLMSFKVSNKGDSNSRQGLLIVSSVSQVGTEPNTEHSRNKKHKSLHEDITAVRLTSGTKEIRRSESSSRIGYTSNAGKHAADNNVEQPLKGRESSAKKERTFNDSLDTSRSNGKGEFSVHQGNMFGQNTAKSDTVHINGQSQTEKESQWRDKFQTRELTSPRRSIKNGSSDRSSYLIPPPAGKTHTSGSEPNFPKDSYSRKDNVRAANVGQETTSPRKINQTSRIEYAYNPYNGNRVTGQTTEKEIATHNSSIRKDNKTSDTKTSSPSSNGNKESRSIRDIDNISHSDKNKTVQSPLKKDYNSRRGKLAGDSAKNGKETNQIKVVNTGDELRSKHGYTLGADKRKDQSYLLELSRIGKEKIAAIQRRDSSLQMNEFRRRKNEITKKTSKQTNYKKEKTVEDVGGQRSVNISPTGSLKGDSRITQAPSVPGVAKWNQDRKLEQSNEIKESNRRFERRMEETMSQGSETNSPRIKSEPIRRQHYMNSVAEMNDFERRFTSKDSGRNRVEKRAGNLRQGVGDLRQGVGDLRQGVGDLRQGVGDLRQGVGDLREGVGDLRQGVGDLRQGVGDLRQGVGDLRQGVGDIRQGVGDLRQGVQNISPRTTLKSEFRETQKYLKSPTLEKNTPSNMADHPYPAIENGSRNRNETRDAGNNGHETSPRMNTRMKVTSRHSNTEQKSEHSNTEQENVGIDSRKSKERNLRQELASKLNTKSRSSDKETHNSNWNIAHNKVDQTCTGKEGCSVVEKNIDDKQRQKQEESPTGNNNCEQLNGRHGHYTAPVKIMTGHQMEQQDGKEDSNSWNEKALAASVGLDNVVSRAKMKSELNNRQGVENNKSMPHQLLVNPCVTGESETAIEKTEETISPVNNAHLMSYGHVKGKEDSPLTGTSAIDHAGDQQQTTRDDLDQNNATPCETSVPENVSCDLRMDPNINKDSAEFKTDIPEDSQPQIQPEQSTFENNLSESINNNTGAYDWQRKASNKDLTETRTKPVHGYIKHQGASRTKQTFSKTMEAPNSDQPGLEKVDLTQQNMKSIADYSSAKYDNSPKVCHLMMEDSVDFARNENRQCTAEVAAVKGRRTHFDPRGYKNGQKVERITHGEIESSQNVYEKKDTDRPGATNNKQSGNKTYPKNNEGGENISKRSDPPSQINGNSDRKGTESLRNADHIAVESALNNKPARMIKSEHEDKFGDRYRNKISGRRQWTHEQETREGDTERQSRQLNDKLNNYQSGNLVKEDYRTDLERFIIKHGLKVLDDTNKKLDNTKPETYPQQGTAERMHSIDLYNKLNNADSKNASKKWKTEIHRKTVRSETDKNDEIDKYDFSSSVDENWRTSNSASKQQLHLGEGRNYEELKKKQQEVLNGEMNTDKSNTDRRNTRQNQQGRFAGKGSSSTNSVWRNEPNDVNKKTVAKYEIETAHAPLGEKTRKRLITAKKSQTDTNQTDRYISTMTDSSVVDNVARAWMEDIEKGNTKDVKMFYPSTMKQTPHTTLMNYTIGIRAGKTSKVQQSPNKTGKDYLDIFPRPTFLTNSKPHEPEEPDLSPMKSSHGLNRHPSHKQQHNDNVFQDGEFTGNRLVTIDRDGKRERNYFGKPAKPGYSKLDQLVPQTVSVDSRSYLNHLVGSKSRDIRKQLTKDDCFIYQGHLQYYNDIDPAESTRAVDKQTARHNRMDWGTSEKSNSARDKRGKEQASHGVLEERVPMKPNQDVSQRTTTTHAQKMMDQKNLKTPVENSHVSKATPDSTKETRPPSKNTRNNKTHEASHGSKSTSENSKNNKLDNAKHSKSTSDNSKGTKTVESSKDRKPNSEARAHMFSYKVSSKGTRSEVIKSTQRGSQLAVNAEKDESEVTKQNPQVVPVLETAVDVLKEVVSDKREEITKCESTPEPVQLGLFARLLNTLTRSTKVVSTAQTNDTVVKPEQKQDISNKPSPCSNEQMLSETVSSGKEKCGGYMRNKPLFSRSPAMSVRDAKNLRSDYKQNMNCNADCCVYGASNPEPVERCGAVIETWTSRGEKLNCLPNKASMRGKASTSPSCLVGEWSTSMIIAILTLCVGASYPVIWTYCSDSLQPSVYELQYVNSLFSLGVDNLVNKTYMAEKPVTNGQQKKYAS